MIDFGRAPARAEALAGSVAVPLGSIVFAFIVMAVVLAPHRARPDRDLPQALQGCVRRPRGMDGDVPVGDAAPLHRPRAAVAFRMNLFNIGAEGQLYLGALCSLGIAIWLGPDPDGHDDLRDVRLRRGRRRALGPDRRRAEGVRADERDHHDADAQLRRGAAADVPDLRQRVAVARPLDDPDPVVPAVDRACRTSQFWPTLTPGDVIVPFGFLLAIGVAVGLWVLFRRTRFGFEMSVIGDSHRAARYSGMRTRRKILAVMGLSGAVAGLGGASQVGDFSHVLDASPQGLQGAAFGYTGIVVAALARYNPLAVVLVGVLIGGLQNAGLYLQGPDFPTGLVGVHAGDHPVLRTRRRAVDPLPRAVRAPRRPAGGGAQP